MAKIEFKEFGRVYLPIFIKPYGNSIMKHIDFKVDTGADSTTISKKVLSDLGYSMNWIELNAFVFSDADKPTTASGEKVNAGFVQLPLINLLGYEGKFWPFQIIIDEKQDFRNLLGRDLLTGFNYQFNNDDDEFLINMAKAFKPRYKLLHNQEIKEIEHRD